jgi:hypothetical protein
MKTVARKKEHIYLSFNDAKKLKRGTQIGFKGVRGFETVSRIKVTKDTFNEEVCIYTKESDLNGSFYSIEKPENHIYII